MPSLLAKYGSELKPSGLYGKVSMGYTFMTSLSISIHKRLTSIPRRQPGIITSRPIASPASARVSRGYSRINLSICASTSG